MAALAALRKLRADFGFAPRRERGQHDKRRPRET